MRLLLYICAFLLLTLPLLAQPGDTTNPYYRPPFVIEKIDAIHSKSSLYQDVYSFQRSRLDKDSNIYIHLRTSYSNLQSYDAFDCKHTIETPGGRTVNIKVDKTFSNPITVECMPKSDSMRIGISAAYEYSNGDILYIGHDNYAFGGKIAFELRAINQQVKNYKTYGGSRDQRRIITRKHPDGGIVVMALFSGDGDGDIGGNTTIKCGDFNNHDIWVFKTDSLGNMTHSTHFGSIRGDGMGDMNILPNGEIFLMLGIGGPGGINCDLGGCTSNTTTWNNNLYDIMGVQLDANLNLLWSKCYGGSGMEHPHQIFVSPINGGVDGYWIASGTNSTDGMLDTIPQEIDNYTSYVWLFKINTQGEIQKQTAIPIKGLKLNDMKASLDGKIWIALETPQLTTTPISYYYTEKLGTSEVLILQLDTNLYVERKKLLGGTFDQYDPRLYPLSDSSMMIGLGYYYYPKSGERYFMDKLTDSSMQAYVMLKVRAQTDTFQYNDTITTYQIYPNPVTDKSIQIRVPRFENLQAYMYNALGQLVGKLKLEEGINTWKLDEGLASGIYIVQLYAEEGKKVYQQKLVVQ